MSLIWNAKNNFLLLHFINLYQQSSTFDIHWPTIVHHIRLDMFSTSIELQKQYEHLLKVFQLENNPKLLYSIIKRDYLHSLCQNIEDNSNSTLITIYQLLRHAREKQIDANDIQQLINNWNFNYSSDKQKQNKNHLSNILNRLHESICQLSPQFNQITDNHLIKSSYTNGDGCEHIINIDNHDSNRNTTDQEKFPTNRRRTQSLTILDENKTDQTNVGVEWFVPISKRQQRSNSLDSRSQSPISSNSLILQNQPSNEIESASNSNSQQIHIQSVISFAPVTDEQIIEKKRRHSETKIFVDEDLEQISSSESELSSVDDSNENSSKRQRVS